MIECRTQMSQVNVEGTSPQSGVNAEAASSDVAAHFQAWVVLCICCSKPFTTLAIIISCSPISLRI